MIESICLGDGLAVSDTVQGVVQFDVVAKMPVGFFMLPSKDTDMRENLVGIAFTHRITVFHHLFAIEVGRVWLTNIIINLAKQSIHLMSLCHWHFVF